MVRVLRKHINPVLGPVAPPDVQPVHTDRVLQSLAWKLADQLGWPDTFVAEYIALTQLQADAFVCIDPALARAVDNTVTVASIDDLLGSA